MIFPKEDAATIRAGWAPSRWGGGLYCVWCVRAPGWPHPEAPLTFGFQRLSLTVDTPLLVAYRLSTTVDDNHLQVEPLAMADGW